MKKTFTPFQKKIIAAQSARADRDNKQACEFIREALNLPDQVSAAARHHAAMALDKLISGKYTIGDKWLESARELAAPPSPAEREILRNAKAKQTREAIIQAHQAAEMAEADIRAAFSAVVNADTQAGYLASLILEPLIAEQAEITRKLKRLTEAGF